MSESSDTRQLCRTMAGRARCSHIQPSALAVPGIPILYLCWWRPTPQCAHFRLRDGPRPAKTYARRHAHQHNAASLHFLTVTRTAAPKLVVEIRGGAAVTLARGVLDDTRDGPPTIPSTYGDMHATGRHTAALLLQDKTATMERAADETSFGGTAPRARARMGRSMRSTRFTISLFLSGPTNSTAQRGLLATTCHQLTRHRRLEPRSSSIFPTSNAHVPNGVRADASLDAA